MKTKLLTRFCFLLLCMAMLLPCMVACGKEDEKKADPIERDTSAPTVEDNLPERDMELFELTFLNYTDAAHGFSLKTICTDDISESVNEAIFYRNMEVEERFNAVILEQQTDEMTDTMTQSVLAGTGDKFQIAMVYDAKVNVVNVAGLLATWDIMPYCDFSRDWWNEDAGNCFSINGKQYGAVGDFSLSMHSKNYCYFFNKSIYSTIPDSDDLYGLVRDGKWTIEKMLEIGELYTSDLTGDGLWYDGTDQYGIAGTTKVNYQLIFSGAGMRFVELNDEGVPCFALNNGPSIEKLSKLITMFEDTYSYYNNNHNEPNGGIKSSAFLDGKVLIFASTVWNMTAYKNYDIDYGVLPAPKYDEQQARYYSVAVGGQVACISRAILDDETENVSILLEAMSCYSHNNVVPVYKETTLKSRFSKAPEDAEMLQLIFDSTIFDLGTSVWDLDIRRPIMADLFNDLDSGVNSYITSLASVAEGVISKSINVK